MLLYSGGRGPPATVTADPLVREGFRSLAVPTARTPGGMGVQEASTAMKMFTLKGADPMLPRRPSEDTTARQMRLHRPRDITTIAIASLPGRMLSHIGPAKCPSATGVSLCSHSPLPVILGVRIMRGNRTGLPDDTVSSGPSAKRPPSNTRITVALVAKAAADLRRILTRTHMSQTDVVNRALSLYEFVDSEVSSGAELIIRRDGQEHRVVLL
jgi:hypothetical protein